MKDAIRNIVRELLIQKPIKSDAVIWLQGDEFERGHKVLDLYHQGYTPVILLTGNNIRIEEKRRDGYPSLRIEEMLSWLVSNGVSPSHCIVDAYAMHTRDQAVHTLQYAVQNEWQRIIVVASPYHQLRAFLTFLQRANEVGWNGVIINQTAVSSIREIQDLVNGVCIDPRFQQELKKMEQYPGHVASLSGAYAHLCKDVSTYDRVILRPAIFEDIDFLFHLRNESAVRKYSKNSKPISFDEHVAWLKKTLKDTTRILLIVLFDKQPIGQVRFDRSDDKAEISISLIETARGKGLGAFIIKQGLEILFANMDVRKVIAHIKKENIKSIRVFQRIGFMQDNPYDLSFTTLSYKAPKKKIIV